MILFDWQCPYYSSQGNVSGCNNEGAQEWQESNCASRNVFSLVQINFS
jgi:hypothetical protein